MAMISAELKDIIGWDISNWSLALDFWESGSALDLNGCKGLELGAKQGGLSLWLALKGCEVICSDLSSPEKDAHILHEKYQVTNSIEYMAIDATGIPFENEFDIIIFKSILGGIGRDNNIERQKKVISEIYKALKPGGEVYFAENLSASPVHRFFRRNFIAWGKSWRYVTESEIRSYFSHYSKISLRSSGFLGGFGRNEFQRRLFSFIDKKLLNSIAPHSWHYILFGVAKK
jgi:SAM-dependent methyltransferase